MTTFIIGLVAIILEWLLTYAIQLENDNTVKDLHGKIKHLEYEKKFKEYELKIMEKEDELKQLRLNPPSENSEPNQAEQEEQSS